MKSVPTAFESILQSAARYWDVFDADDSSNVALGLLRCTQGAIKARLSLSDVSRALCLEVLLRGAPEPNPRQLAELLEHQAKALFTKLVYDREDRTLSVRSAAIWIAAPGNEEIVHSLFEDMIRFLNDEEIGVLSRHAA